MNMPFCQVVKYYVQYFDDNRCYMKQIDKLTGTISRCKHFGVLTKIRNLLF